MYSWQSDDSDLDLLDCQRGGRQRGRLARGDIRNVTTPASASGGSIGLTVNYRTGAVPAFARSDGTLALFSLVAVAASTLANLLDRCWYS